MSHSENYQIGNYVKIKGGRKLRKITTSHSKLSKDNELTGYVCLDFDSEEIPFIDVVPICIKEDLLLKIGFINISKDSLGGVYLYDKRITEKLYIRFEIDLVYEIMYDDIDVIFYGQKSRCIPYLHDLQNLIYEKFRADIIL